jgi:hypothetical protein
LGSFDIKAVVFSEHRGDQGEFFEKNFLAPNSFLPIFSLFGAKQAAGVRREAGRGAY